MKIKYLRDLEGKVDKKYVIAKNGSYIRNKITGEKLERIMIHGGYRKILICINGKKTLERISHLQRRAWKEEIIDGCDVHHIDGNKLNDNIDNLKKLSRSEHIKIHMKGENNPMYGKKLSEWYKKRIRLGK